MNAPLMNLPGLKVAWVALAAVFAVAACQSTPLVRQSVTNMRDAPVTSPLWREDVAHLAEDHSTIESCFTATSLDDADESHCAGVVISLCVADLSAESATTGAMRACVWRGIAAWEEVLSAAADSYLADARDDEQIGRASCRERV